MVVTITFSSLKAGISTDTASAVIERRRARSTPLQPAIPRSPGPPARTAAPHPARWRRGSSNREIADDIADGQEHRPVGIERSPSRGSLGITWSRLEAAQFRDRHEAVALGPQRIDQDLGSSLTRAGCGRRRNHAAAPHCRARRAGDRGCALIDQLHHLVHRQQSASPACPHWRADRRCSPASAPRSIGTISSASVGSASPR